MRAEGKVSAVTFSTGTGGTLAGKNVQSQRLFCGQSILDYYEITGLGDHKFSYRRCICPSAVEYS